MEEEEEEEPWQDPEQAALVTFVSAWQERNATIAL
jgi:hypothetical protein